MLIIIGMVLAIFMIEVIWNSHNTMVDYVAFTFFGLVVSGLVAGAGIGVGAWYESHHPSDIREDTYNLAALSSGTGVSGSFFLGIGTINSEPMYFYYYKTDDGGLRMDYTNADLTVVKQDATPETSYITYYCEDYDVNDFWSWPFHAPEWNDCFNYVNEIHIPPGSIDENFDSSLPK